jgi:hypothetical protein
MYLLTSSSTPSAGPYPSATPGAAMSNRRLGLR